MKWTYRVRCIVCGWTGYRRQKSFRDAALDSCPQCGEEVLALYRKTEEQK